MARSFRSGEHGAWRGSPRDPGEGVRRAHPQAAPDQRRRRNRDANAGPFRDSPGCGGGVCAPRGVGQPLFPGRRIKLGPRCRVPSPSRGGPGWGCRRPPVDEDGACTPTSNSSPHGGGEHPRSMIDGVAGAANQARTALSCPLPLAGRARVGVPAPSHGRGWRLHPHLQLLPAWGRRAPSEHCPAMVLHKPYRHSVQAAGVTVHPGSLMSPGANSIGPSGTRP